MKSSLFLPSWIRRMLWVALAAAGMTQVTATTIEFDPFQPLVVTDAGGFTGSTTLQTGYTRARLIFEFTDLNPSPLSAPFLITSLSLDGDGISTPLAFTSGVSVIENGMFFSEFLNLSGTITDLEFSNNTVSFELPEDVINLGASFRIFVQYGNTNGTQINTSGGGSFYSATIPEPSTALLGLLGSALLLRRKRNA